MIGRSRVASALAAAFASLALAAGCSSGESDSAAPETTPAAPSRFADLHVIDELRTAFNAEANIPRLVLLLSPT